MTLNNGKKLTYGILSLFFGILLSNDIEGIEEKWYKAQKLQPWKSEQDKY